MDAKQVANKLIDAAKFSVNPAFSLLSYHGGDWVLVSSGNVAADIASEYVRFAISGQLGDCLELRCNGVRVSLNAQLISDASLKIMGGELRMQVAPSDVNAAIAACEQENVTVLAQSTISQQQQCNAAKRASTTAKLTKTAIDQMITFMVANHCGMIIRYRGVEVGVTVQNNTIVLGYSLVLEYPDNEFRRIVLGDCTIRKGWNSDNLVNATQWWPDASYRAWESAYAHELWRMDCPDMLAYA